MKYNDYHLHTEYSFDSTEKMENVCKKAVEKYMKEICFTEHVEFGVDDAGEWPDFAKRDKEILRLQNELNQLCDNPPIILKGVEIGQAIKNLTSEKELLEKNSFDFVIASMHVVGDYGRPSKFDFSIEENYIKFFRDYFREIKELAVKCEYDVLGHLTFPFRYASPSILNKYPIDSYKQDFMELLEIVIDRNKGIEVNTSGYRMPVLCETLPGISILKWYKELGGRIITVGSDGHSSQSAFRNIEDGYKVVKEAGFDEIHLFRDRKVVATEQIMV